MGSCKALQERDQATGLRCKLVEMPPHCPTVDSQCSLSYSHYILPPLVSLCVPQSTSLSTSGLLTNPTGVTARGLLHCSCSWPSGYTGRTYGKRTPGSGWWQHAAVC